MRRHRRHRPYHLSNRICQAGSTAGKGEVKSKYLTRSKRLSAPLPGAAAWPPARLGYIKWPVAIGCSARTRSFERLIEETKPDVNGLNLLPLRT